MIKKNIGVKKMKEKISICIKCGKETTNGNRARNMCEKCYANYLYHNKVYKQTLEEFLSKEINGYHKQDEICIKCHKDRTVGKNLCRKCYCSYRYHLVYNNVSMEDFLTNNYTTYDFKKHKVGQRKVGYDKFVNDYKELILTKKVKVNDYCKENHISRQAFYERLKRYKNRNAL